jgi:L-threonylcarbamoyladenylate synthase
MSDRKAARKTALPPVSGSDPADILQAAAILSAGGLVAFPTETVYGLGADAENPAAISRIYTAKGRPANHPVIVHLSPEADLGYWANTVPDAALQLIAAFWPGPLSLILPRAHHIPDLVSGGQDTIGLRCPSHPVAQALLRAFKQGRGGIAAPSANKFGHVSPTTAFHVQQEFAMASGSSPASSQEQLLTMILDGGASEVGIESTILDLSRLTTHGPVLLRPGHVTEKQIAQVLGRMPNRADADAPRASGTLASHYAPRTPLLLQTVEALTQSAIKLQKAGRSFAVLSHSMHPPTGASAVRHLACEATAYAHDLYAALRELDQTNAFVILLEAPPDTLSWQGVNDRLRRAAHGSDAVLNDLS